MSADDDACTVQARTAGAVQPVQGDMLGVPFRVWRTRLARERGLPDEDIVAGAGHQAELWHPGVLAKYVWADHLASGRVIHLVVDTDTRDPLTMRIPVLADGALRMEHHAFAGTHAPGAIARARAAHAPRVRDASAPPLALPCVAEGFDRMVAALARWAGEPDAAAQVTRALGTCLEGVPGLGTAGALGTAPWVRTSELVQSPLGQALLDHAERDAAACAGAFNHAVRRVPRAARPLGDLGTAGVELPFWAIERGGTRRRIGHRELPALRREGVLIAPRALLTSAIARASLCDRFVHGLGGEVYEQATDAFIEAWLGVRLPAFDMATASVRLPFPSTAHAPVVTHAERRRAWFDPDSTGATGPSGAKRALLAAVGAAPRRSAARRAAWRAMHAHLAQSRDTHAAALAELAARETADRAQARASLVRRERTWAAPLYPAQLLTQMAERLRHHR